MYSPCGIHGQKASRERHYSDLLVTMAVVQQSDNFAARDLSQEWKSCCMLALGHYDWEKYEAEQENNRGSSSSSSSLQIVSLLPQHEEKQGDRSSRGPKDIWTETALKIHENLLEMCRFLEEKKYHYTSVYMDDDEASLIQSTITSFIAATANEIESLRRLITTTTSITHTNQDVQQHQTGVVQILLETLQTYIVEPFGKYQKQRSRPAVKIWQHPLSCQLVPPDTTNTIDDEMDDLLGLTTTTNKPKPSSARQSSSLKFLPSRPTHGLQRDFLRSYETSSHVTSEIVSTESPLRRRRQRRSRSETTTTTTTNASLRLASPDTKRQKPMPPIKLPQDHRPGITNENNDINDNLYTSPQALEQESAQLLLQVSGDLDQVQQMEERMVAITTLLSQFAGMVSLQHEQVNQIRDDTAAAKDHVQSGQDNLLQAKERTEQSKHRMAKVITSMGIVLLLFHWARP